MLSAATDGLARMWFCPAMGFATARFALDYLIAALVGAATVILLSTYSL